jgi:hypothetical protein
VRERPQPTNWIFRKHWPAHRWRVRNTAGPRYWRFYANLACSKLSRRPLAKPELFDEPINVRVERTIFDEFCLLAHQHPHVNRKLIRFWHRRSVEQHRHDGYGAKKGRANLNADKVIRIVEPPSARRGVSVSNPITANEGK